MRPNITSRAFTLVELIVVISILAILATIAFLSFTGYQSSARDSARSTDLQNISKSLDISLIKAGSYPSPDSSITVSYSWWVLWYQGTIGNGIISRISGVGGINKKPTDPLLLTDYMYSVLAYGNAYQIRANYEADTLSYDLHPRISETASAESGNPKINYIKGNYFGLMAKTQTGSTIYVLSLPSILTTATGSSDVTTLSGTFLLHGQSNMGIGFTPAIVFSGTSLPKDDTTSQITTMMTALKTVYSGATMAVTTQPQIKNLLTTPSGTQTTNLGSSLITNTLWGNANQISLSSTGTTFTCSGTAPVQITGMSISSVSPTNNTTVWSYSGTTTTSCTWTCNATYTQNGNSCSPQAYVDDVFSTTLYTGVGGTQNIAIAGGLDLSAADSGLSWIKARVTHSNGSNDHFLVRSKWSGLGGAAMSSNMTSGNNTLTTGEFQANSNGTVTLANGALNGGTGSPTFTLWTFKKAPKFFDVVTWTGNSVLGRQISHNLGITPGMVIIKRTDSTSDWNVWHTSLSGNNMLVLNTTAAQATNGAALLNSTAPTSSSFTVTANPDVNVTGGSYVAYLFADDSSTSGLIRCGSVALDASGLWTVTLGWEPQYLITKNSTAGGAWVINDTTREMDYTTTLDLYTNTSSAESNPMGLSLIPNANGFKVVGGHGVNNTMIYCAIRRPNKPATNGSQVFTIGTYNQSSATDSAFDAAFPVDMAIQGVPSSWMVGAISSRLSWAAYLQTTSQAVEATSGGSATAAKWDFPTWWFSSSTITPPYTQANWYSWMFRRSPGFFDVVSYTWDGVAWRAITHNLGVAPELIMIKNRSNALSWAGDTILPPNNIKEIGFDSNSQSVNYSSYPTNYLQSTPTSTSFFVTSVYGVNFNSSNNYIAYLFASKQDISKIGSYSWSSSQQDITYGYSNAPRFLLVKRTDTAGDWFVYDTTRGMTSSVAPHFSLNTTAAEVASTDVESITGGFRVKTSASATINIPGASYIYLAIH